MGFQLWTSYAIPFLSNDIQTTSKKVLNGKQTRVSRESSVEGRLGSSNFGHRILVPFCQTISEELVDSHEGEAEALTFGSTREDSVEPLFPRKWDHAL